MLVRSDDIRNLNLGSVVDRVFKTPAWFLEEVVQESDPSFSWDRVIEITRIEGLSRRLEALVTYVNVLLIMGLGEINSSPEQIISSIPHRNAVGPHGAVVLKILRGLHIISILDN